MVIFCKVGMQQGRRFVSFIENPGELLLSRFELAATLLQHIHWHRVLEKQIEDLLMLPLNPFEFGLGGFDRYTGCHPGLVHLTCELVAKLLEEFRFHQVLVEPVQDARFQRVAADVEPVVASSFRSGIGASEDVLGDHRIAATAAAAFDQTSEKVFWASAIVQAQIVAGTRSRLQRELSLPRFDRVP